MWPETALLLLWPRDARRSDPCVHMGLEDIVMNRTDTTLLSGDYNSVVVEGGKLGGVEKTFLTAPEQRD